MYDGPMDGCCQLFYHKKDFDGADICQRRQRILLLDIGPPGEHTYCEGTCGAGAAALHGTPGMRMNTMNTEPVRFTNNLGQRIAGRICRGDIPSRRGVIFCHGLFSTKDGYKITSLAEDIVAAGYTLLTFDFSFVGESDGKLEDLSVLQEVKDLECAAAFFLGSGIDELHLVGSSMGGAVSLLYCAGSGVAVKSLTLIATPLNLKKLLEDNTGIRDMAALPEDGVTSIDGISIKNGFFREAALVDLTEAAAGVEAPALIVHGARDRVVNVTDAYLLAALLKGDRKLVIVSDGDHHLTRPADIARLREELLFHLARRGPCIPPLG